MGQKSHREVREWARVRSREYHRERGRQALANAVLFLLGLISAVVFVAYSIEL